MCSWNSRILRRIQKDICDVISSKELEEKGIYLKPLNDQLTRLRATIDGPPNSPYEGGKFVLDIIIPDHYPFQPCKVKFTTRLWHPNVSTQRGIFCRQSLAYNWSPAYNLHIFLLSVHSLLAHPESDDPGAAVVANQKRFEPELFERTARFWTQHYAKGSGVKDAEFVQKIDTLKEMGASEDKAIWSLSSCGWDLEKATEYIFKFTPRH